MALTLLKITTGPGAEENVRKDLATIEASFNAALVPKAAVIALAGVAQSITNATYMPVSFNMLDGVDASIFRTSPTRFTVPKTGFYLINFNGFFASNAAGSRISKVRRNGVGDISGSLYVCAGTVSGNTVMCSLLTNLNVNDYIEFLVYQDSGGALDFGTTVLTSMTRASLLQVG